MDISNKTLAMFLVAAIVVSIAGTVISLNRLGEMGSPVSPTGFVTSGAGNVTLTVGSTLSITMATDTINFGTCSPNSSRDTRLRSVAGDVNTTALCGSPASGSIVVRNDGNILANVSLNVSNTGEADGTGTFLPSVGGDSRIGYRIDNSTVANPGCLGSFESSWVWFTSVKTFMGCEKLNFVSGGDRFALEAQILLPQDALTTTGAEDFIITFWAQNA